jgi:peptidyl-prolyl cis-trans isomerase SurA
LYLKLILLISICISFSANAKLLDKIIAVVDSRIITLSQVKRIKVSLAPRRNISPMIFNKAKFSNKEVVELLIQRHIIRDRLGEMGYVVSDEQVEAQIKETESRLGLNRDKLLDFLNSNNVTFDEYFELVRETYEFNIFNERVIRPLISVTEQEIKNTFYKENQNNKTLSFKYTLVDFSMPKSLFKKGMLSKFTSVLKKFQADGSLPNQYAKVSTELFADISEDGLTKNLRKVLKKTNEGSFTRPVKIGSDQHVFFIKKKDVVESEVYQNSKPRIRNKLYSKLAGGIRALWFKREINKHYVKYFY